MDGFRIVSPFAPTVVRALDGRRYAVAIGSPWIEIPEEMTSGDVHAGWVKPERAPSPPRKPAARRSVGRRRAG